MRKRFVTTFITFIIVVVSAFAISGCGSSKSVEGKKYLLNDITLSFDSNVDADDKKDIEERVSGLLKDVENGAEIYCYFFESHGFLTNYNGEIMCGVYNDEDGEIKITDNSTSENINFKNEENTVTLTETQNGITANYIFNFSEMISRYSRNEQVNFTENTYKFVAISQIFFKDFTEREIINYKSELITSEATMTDDYITFNIGNTFNACIGGKTCSGTYEVQGNGKSIYFTPTQGTMASRNFTIENENILSYFSSAPTNVNRPVYLMLQK